jgi:hypothetical protein
MRTFTPYQNFIFCNNRNSKLVVFFSKFEQMGLSLIPFPEKVYLNTRI